LTTHVLTESQVTVACVDKNMKCNPQRLTFEFCK